MECFDIVNVVLVVLLVVWNLILAYRVDDNLETEKESYFRKATYVVAPVIGLGICLLISRDEM